MNTIDMNKLTTAVNDGLVMCKKHPTAALWIYDYTPKTQYEKRWDEITMRCRGLIVDENGNIVARPFPKFFNYGEKMPEQRLQIVEATEKMDGSLGILYWVDNIPYIATRGSFTSDQAIWASNWIQPYAQLLEKYRPNTLLFEIIYPENRVVVDYGEMQELVLIGMYDQYEVSAYWSELQVIADNCGFRTPAVYRMDNIHQYLEFASQMSANAEGFVVRYSNGERYKVKGNQYLVAHKLLHGISFNRVLEATQNGTIDQWLDGVPDEFLSTINGYRDTIAQRIMAARIRVENIFNQSPKDVTRKEFAKWATTQKKGDLPYLFALYDGFDITPMLYKREF